MIVTEWDEFRTVDWDRLSAMVEHRVVLDGRNMFDPLEITSKGFRYISIGRTGRTPSAGMSLGKIRYKASTKKLKNRVLAQSPKPGKKLAKNARVNLTVGRGRKK